MYSSMIILCTDLHIQLHCAFAFITKKSDSHNASFKFKLFIRKIWLLTKLD